MHCYRHRREFNVLVADVFGTEAEAEVEAAP